MVRFGFVGTGLMAGKLKAALERTDKGTLTAVLSRDIARAQAFGARHAFDRLEDMLRCPEVDVVYIATPHPFHFEAARAALNAGKGVLCEKPACLWRSQVETLADLAARRNVLFVEAMWTRFLPAYKTAKQWLGSIGEVHSLTASFCALSRLSPESRLFDPALGGGALYDLGCYPLAFAQGIFGTWHDEMTGVAVIGPTGVDECATVTLRFGQAIATVQFAVNVQQPQDAIVYGTEGSVTIPTFWGARSCSQFDGKGRLVRHFEDPQENGYVHQIDHIDGLLARGKPESPDMPWQDSVYLAAVYDELREQWGLPV